MHCPVTISTFFLELPQLTHVDLVNRQFLMFHSLNQPVLSHLGLFLGLSLPNDSLQSWQPLDHGQNVGLSVFVPEPNHTLVPNDLLLIGHHFTA